MPKDKTANADGKWNSEIRYSTFGRGLLLKRGEVRWMSGLTGINYRETGQLEEHATWLSYDTSL